jgi:hypothetical protein
MAQVQTGASTGSTEPQSKQLAPAGLFATVQNKNTRLRSNAISDMPPRQADAATKLLASQSMSEVHDFTSKHHEDLFELRLRDGVKAT